VTRATIEVVEYTQITVHREGPVAVLTLTRPERLNAWTPTMAEEQVDAIRAANDDPSVGAIVMTGAGRGFCAGADMEATFRTRIDGGDPGNDTAAGVGGMPRGLDWVDFLRTSKPVVCAVNGAAVGIGTTMLLHCDLVYASPGARFQLPFVPLGLVPEAASSLLLPAIAGYQRAAELLLLGQPFTAEKALAAGFVTEIVPEAELLEYARNAAASIAALPPASVRLTKQLMKRPLGQAVPAQMEEERRIFAERLGSGEAKEAMTAFFEKRRPDFSRF
jgi:enoyl-CoA hydratase/carnithine racemase